MTNLYFIESDNHIILNKILEDIVKENKFNLADVIKFDLSERNISEVITELDTYGLFSDRKIVFAYDAIFLSSDKSEIDHDIDAFTKYINNPKEDSVLVLACRKLDGKKNIVKLVKEKCQVIETKIDTFKYIKDYVKGYLMPDEVIRYLITNTTEDIAHITNELDKLMAYKQDEKEITKNDIDLITIKKMDNNIFDLIDAIISKNKAKSLLIYNEIINYGEDIFKIFVSLSNQIRLIYQVKTLKKMTNEEIATKLNLKNVKQVMALRYKIDKYNSSELLDYLYRLSIMDEELKLGKSIDKIVFPTFIASL